MGWFEIFWLGCLGGFIAEFVAVFSHKDRPTVLPPKLKSPLYIIIGIIYIIIGGILSAFLLEGLPEDMSKIIPLQSGMTAPLIIQRMMAGIGNQVDNALPPLGSTDGTPSP